MSDKITEAIELIAGKISDDDVTADEVLTYTQSALNLAKTKKILVKAAEALKYTQLKEEIET